MTDDADDDYVMKDLRITLRAIWGRVYGSRHSTGPLSHMRMNSWSANQIITGSWGGLGRQFRDLQHFNNWCCENCKPRIRIEDGLKDRQIRFYEWCQISEPLEGD